MALVLEGRSYEQASDEDVRLATSGDEEVSSDEREGRIRVGRDFQATVPGCIPNNRKLMMKPAWTAKRGRFSIERRPEQMPERALLVWSPASTITTAKLDEYIQVAKEKYGYNAEQALGMLFWHKHDLDKALQVRGYSQESTCSYHWPFAGLGELHALSRRVDGGGQGAVRASIPIPRKVVPQVRHLYSPYWLIFLATIRIRQMLPDKSIAQLVKYYYGWKKTRTRTSLMDRQARKLRTAREEDKASKDADEPESKKRALEDTSVSSNNREESEEEEEDEDKGSPAVKRCFNCGIPCHYTHPTTKGQMCGTCQQYFVRTGEHFSNIAAPFNVRCARTRSADDQPYAQGRLQVEAQLPQAAQLEQAA